MANGSGGCGLSVLRLLSVAWRCVGAAKLPEREAEQNVQSV